MCEHEKIYIYLAVDSFYVQCELNKNTSLLTQAVIVEQKNVVISVNKVGIEFGIKESMPVCDARKICFNLVAINGENERIYKKISDEICGYLKDFGDVSNGGGLCEKYVDVTKCVKNNLEEQFQSNNYQIYTKCECEKIKIGRELVNKFQDMLKTKFNLTCRSGVAHTKILAKADSDTLTKPDVAKCKASPWSTLITKLEQLLKRLLILAKNDGRVPKTVCVTVRKFDSNTSSTCRDSKEGPINIVDFSKKSEEKIMSTIFILFKKLCSPQQPFHITLLGVSFTKFKGPQLQKNALSSFIAKEKCIEVQTLTNTIYNTVNKEESIHLKPFCGSPSIFLDSDSDEPSPKKSRFFDRLPKNAECVDSPSKLKVADLKLTNDCLIKCDPNSRKRELDYVCSSQAKKIKTAAVLNYFVKP